jgi:FMN reductase
MPDATPEVVVLIGNPRSGSRTSAIATAVAEAIRTEGDGIEVRTVELADAIAVSLDGTAAQPVAPQPDLIDVVRSARLLVVATPSYKGSYTGLLKLVFDQLPHQSLDGITAVPVVVAGAPVHLRTTTADLIRLLTELGAAVPATVELLEADLASAGPHIARAARQTAAHVFAASPTS